MKTKDIVETVTKLFSGSDETENNSIRNNSQGDRTSDLASGALLATADKVIDHIPSSTLTASQREALKSMTHTLADRVSSTVDSTLSPEVHDSLIGAAGAIASAYSMMEKSLGNAVHGNADALEGMGDSITSIAQEIMSTIGGDLQTALTKTMSEEDVKKLKDIAYSAAQILKETSERLTSEKGSVEEARRILRDTEGKVTTASKDVLSSTMGKLLDATNVVKESWEEARNSPSQSESKTLLQGGKKSPANDEMTEKVSHLLQSLSSAAVVGYNKVKHALEDGVDEVKADRSSSSTWAEKNRLLDEEDEKEERFSPRELVKKSSVSKTYAASDPITNIRPSQAIPGLNHMAIGESTGQNSSNSISSPSRKESAFSFSSPSKSNVSKSSSSTPEALESIEFNQHVAEANDKKGYREIDQMNHERRVEPSTEKSHAHLQKLKDDLKHATDRFFHQKSSKEVAPSTKGNDQNQPKQTESHKPSLGEALTGSRTDWVSPNKVQSTKNSTKTSSSRPEKQESTLQTIQNRGHEEFEKLREELHDGKKNPFAWVYQYRKNDGKALNQSGSHPDADLQELQKLVEQERWKEILNHSVQPKYQAGYKNVGRNLELRHEDAEKAQKPSSPIMGPIGGISALAGQSISSLASAADSMLPPVQAIGAVSPSTRATGRFFDDGMGTMSSKNERFQTHSGRRVTPSDAKGDGENFKSSPSKSSSSSWWSSMNSALNKAADEEATDTFHTDMVPKSQKQTHNSNLKKHEDHAYFAEKPSSHSIEPSSITAWAAPLATAWQRDHVFSPASDKDWEREKTTFSPQNNPIKGVKSYSASDTVGVASRPGASSSDPSSPPQSGRRIYVEPPKSDAASSSSTSSSQPRQYYDSYDPHSVFARAAKEQNAKNANNAKNETEKRVHYDGTQAPRFASSPTATEQESEANRTAKMYEDKYVNFLQSQDREKKNKPITTNTNTKTTVKTPISHPDKEIHEQKHGAMEKFAQKISSTVHSMTDKLNIGEKDKKITGSSPATAAETPRVKTISNPVRYNYYASKSGGLLPVIPVQDDLHHKLTKNETIPLSSHPIQQFYYPSTAKTQYSNIDACSEHHIHHGDSPISYVDLATQPLSATFSHPQPVAASHPHSAQDRSVVKVFSVMDSEGTKTAPGKTFFESGTGAPGKSKLHSMATNSSMSEIARKIRQEAGSQNTIAEIPINPITGNEIDLNAGEELIPSKISPSGTVYDKHIPSPGKLHSQRELKQNLEQYWNGPAQQQHYLPLSSRPLYAYEAPESQKWPSQIGTQHHQDHATSAEPWRAEIREKARKIHQKMQEKPNLAISGQNTNTITNPNGGAGADVDLHPVYVVTHPGATPRPVVFVSKFPQPNENAQNTKTYYQATGGTVNPSKTTGVEGTSSSTLYRPLVVATASAVDLDHIPISHNPSQGFGEFDRYGVSLYDRSGFTTDSSDGEAIRRSAEEKYQDDLTDLEDDIDYERRFLSGLESDS